MFSQNQLHYHFRTVEAIFAKMDGLVDQLPEDTFAEGYFAARRVVDAVQRRKLWRGLPAADRNQDSSRNG
jgi:hypothetical protein